jgi:hypothetical protein
MQFATLVGVLAVALALPLAPIEAQRGTVAPRVTVQSLVALPSSAGPQAFRVSLLIDNVGTEPLKIRELDFKLRLADQGILDGRSQAQLTIEALDRQTVTLDVRSDILSSVSRLMSLVRGPNNALAYEIYGTLTPERRLRDPIMFSAAGEVSLVVGGP